MEKLDLKNNLGTRSTTSKKTKKEIMKEESIERKKRKSSFKIELLKQDKKFVPVMKSLTRSLNNYTGSELKLEPDSMNNSMATVKLGRPIIIGITGGSGSGKTLISKIIKRHIKKLGIKCSRIKEKNFLRSVDIKDEEERIKFLKNYDFDSKSAVDWDLFYKCLQNLEERKPFNTPQYDIHIQKRILKTKKIKPADLIIVEGRLFFNDENLRKKCDVKIFMDTDSDIMLSRRVYHHIARKRNLKEIISRYNKFVKPAYEKLIEPNKCFADLVIPNFGGKRFNMKNIDSNSKIVKILLDLLKFRLKDTNIEAKRILDNMSNFENIVFNIDENK